MTTRFTDNGDGTVTDNRTGLMWAKDARKGGWMTWGKARAYCEALNLAGFSDWRLPTRMELESLVDLSNFNPALPTRHPFIGVQATNYWSSTTDTYNTDHAWFVRLLDGSVDALDKSRGYYVWPVRGRYSYT